MKILLACPAPPRSRKGNRVTAERWARLLRELGHRVVIGQEYKGEPCDVLVALHARRSYLAVAAYRRTHPDGPLIVALTGTDLYRDLRHSRRAQRSLELADRLIVLQPLGAREVPARLRSKVRTVYQSARPTPRPPACKAGVFEVSVLGHLRAVKDPFRAALALGLLKEEVRLRVHHAGQALSPEMERRARALEARDPRYHWLGEVSRERARRLLARSRLLVLSSRLEGGANVISEAIVDGVPVLASRIPGSVGLLGAGYPGYFPVGDTKALARLLRQALNEPDFYERLRMWCAGLAPRFMPEGERAAWDRLLSELKDRATRP